ncbi:MAG TPA: hypothetical protein VHN36_15220 [Ilumatobacteraceae bacterium]|nr:hypothetical protein [Ilumatobacteraceae bacterium]
MSNHLGLTRVLAVAALATSAAVAPAGQVDEAAAAVTATSSYVAVSPTRVLDSRIGLGVPGRLASGSSFVLDIGGVAPVPAGASAVVLNVTATNPMGPGFVSAWPADKARPTTSVINFESPGQTIANLVTVPMDAAGGIGFFALTATDLIADVQGYYVPALSSSSGRFKPMTPNRVLDTRLPNAIHAGLVLPGQSVDIDFRPWGVADDAVAVVLNVTVTSATGAGYWTAFAAGAQRPVASNLNVTTPDQTIANQVIAPVAGGAATVFSQSGGHLIVDVAGYYTGASTASASDGLFVPVSPYRLVDTRDPANGGPYQPSAGSQITVPVRGRAGIPMTGVAAVVVNATVTNTKNAGFFTLWPSGTTRPVVSNLNGEHANQTIANHATLPVTDAGFDFYTQAGANLLADVTGWFTATPPAPIPVPPPVPAPGPTGPPDVGGYIIKWASGPGASVPFDQADPQYTPFHWNPCKPIRYVINMNGYNESYRAVISEGIGRVATATGFQFNYVGDTTIIPVEANPWGYPANDFFHGTAPYDIIISLANETITDLVPYSLAGLTWPNWVHYPDKDGRFFVASITMDMGDLFGRPTWAGDGFGPVLLHELGHAMGLDHVSDTTQVMRNGSLPTSSNTYGPGDLRGLWLSGAVRSCTNFGLGLPAS